MHGERKHYIGKQLMGFNGEKRYTENEING